MKYSLPINKKGFTLVELLVIISIIAIISVVGIAVFQGQQRAARDAKRRADVEAIAQAMEAQKSPSAATYPSMALTFFAAGRIPIDPTNTNTGVTSTCGTVCQYCYSLSSTPITTCTGGTSTFITTDTSAPAGWTSSATWTICANLESGTSICRKNAQ